MALSYEYIQFLNEKVLEFLPTQRWNFKDKINFKCPICGDGKTGKKHRAWYYLKNASFYCFNCSTGMSGINFLQYISGNSYEDIKREYFKLYLKSGLNLNLSSNYVIPNKEPSIFDFKQIIKSEWKKPLSDKARQYLENRKVLSAPFLKENLYSCYTKKNDEYILIPWKINGIDAYYQLNDFQKLHSLKYIFPKEKQKLLYGLDNIDINWKNIILTEGVYDSLFVPNCCATGTKSITDYQAQLINERYPHHQIVISFDCDSPGISAMIKLIKENKPYKYFLWWNTQIKQHYKDINEYVLGINNINVFTDKKYVESLCLSPLQAKLFLMKNNLWKNFNV